MVHKLHLRTKLAHKTNKNLSYPYLFIHKINFLISKVLIPLEKEEKTD